ncbi:MAG TPA: TPM domain-containing protein [Nitrospirota bacterium]|nr:TPM domain-containing protein [Nitrospirota bacterium]
MKQYLNDQERTKLNQRIAETEKRTGVQVVLAVIERSDSYHELPWKAFALGAAAGGLAAMLFSQLRPGWPSGMAVLTAVVTTLLVGAACALLCIAVPALARLLLDAHRAEVEVRQYAQALFLDHQLFATRGRTGILLLVSMFERQVVLLPDKGLDKRLTREAMHEIVSGMTAALAAGWVAPALESGLEGLEKRLAATSTGSSPENELPDAVIEEKGS